MSLIHQRVRPGARADCGICVSTDHPDHPEYAATIAPSPGRPPLTNSVPSQIPKVRLFPRLPVARRITLHPAHLPAGLRMILRPLPLPGIHRPTALLRTRFLNPVAPVVPAVPFAASSAQQGHG